MGATLERDGISDRVISSRAMLTGAPGRGHLRGVLKLVAALAAVAVPAGCAAPHAEGHLLSRLAPAQPSRWPEPVPVGDGAGVELTEGALTDAEALRLGPHCTAAVREAVGGTVPGGGDGWRLVVSRLVVDTARGPRGERTVRARAVVEVRVAGRLLAASTGVADLVTSRPSFRPGGAEWGEVSRTVASACAAAVRPLLEPVAALDGDARHRLQRSLASADPGERAGAVEELGRHQDEASAALLRERLGDSDATVRRLAAWALGELADGESAAALGFLAETDPDYAVRVESVTAAGKVLAAQPGRRPAVREGRARGREARDDSAAPADAEPGDDDAGAGRALPLPE